MTTTTQGGLRVDAADCPPQLRAQLNYLLDRLQGQQGMIYNLEPTKKPFVTVTAAYTALGTDYVIRADATGAAFTVTLPPAADVKKRTYQVKKVDVSANAVTVDASGAELIDGAATFSLAAAYDAVTLYSNGTGWDVL